MKEKIYTVVLLTYLLFSLGAIVNLAMSQTSQLYYTQTTSPVYSILTGSEYITCEPT